ncbi:hypothetical protein L596_013414 [Steinernema carpocapsae]|uniref:Uncharacterized protein n=1 Tax=Steinernema carpocapsae TaxID=34508 RepID=A0A4V6A544_STECR|nr:hypothetical protein L596_013414 [Steinernema carpocapsae]
MPANANSGVSVTRICPQSGTFLTFSRNISDFDFNAQYRLVRDVGVQTQADVSDQPACKRKLRHYRHLHLLSQEHVWIVILYSLKNCFETG